MWPPDVGLGTGEGARGWPLWISSVVMVILAGLLVAMRLAHRIHQKWLGADDVLIVIALVMSILLSVTEIMAVNNGYGRHHAELPPDRAILARKWFFGAQIAYKLVLCFEKMAVCAMYYRIFHRSSRRFRIACHLVQTLIVSSGLAFILGTLLQCRPIIGFWNPAVKHVCIDQTPWWIAYPVVQITTDIILLVLPIRQVLHLNMSSSDKYGLIFVFFIGTFTTITSIIRATTLASSSRDPDPTWGPIPATVWAVIEANCGIIAACLPLFRRPFSQLFARIQRSLRALTWRRLMPRNQAVIIGDTMSLPTAPTRYTGGHSANRTVEISSQIQHEQVFESKHSIYLTSDIRVDIEDAEEGRATDFGRFDAE